MHVAILQHWGGGDLSIWGIIISPLAALRSLPFPTIGWSETTYAKCAGVTTLVKCSLHSPLKEGFASLGCVHARPTQKHF